jgi:hypothetical protein
MLPGRTVPSNTPAGTDYHRLSGAWPVDPSLSTTFCPINQLYPSQAEGWPRLRAFPGSIIKPRYSRGNPAQCKDTDKGVMSWYGTREPRLPDTRTFSEILGFQDEGGSDCRARQLSFINNIANKTQS